MRRSILAFSVFLCSIAWWFGMFVGAATSLLVAGGLVLARHVLQRSGPACALAFMPIWQLMLGPILGAPIGLSLGVVAFLLGPGF